jgi:hypothetical protein
MAYEMMRNIRENDSGKVRVDIRSEVGVCHCKQGHQERREALKSGI